MSATIVDNAETLMNDPEALLSELQKEIQGLYEDLSKLRNKNNTTAGGRVRKSLMRLKKFADKGRKVAITDIKSIKGERKSKRQNAVSVDTSDVPDDNKQLETDNQVVEEPPVVTSKPKKSRKSRSRKKKN